MDTLFYPLEWAARTLTYELFGLPEGGRLGAAVEFFLYDTAKIFILLTVIVFAVALVRSYFPPERTRKLLSHMPLWSGNAAAAGLGVLTPF